MTIEPVGVGVVEAIDVVRPGSRRVRCLSLAATSEVEREHHVGLSRRRRRFDEIGAVPDEADVADDGAGLLRQAGLIEPADVAAVEHRRGAEDLGDGDHAGAADAGQAHGESSVGTIPRSGVGEIAGRSAARCAARHAERFAPCVVALGARRS